MDDIKKELIEMKDDISNIKTDIKLIYQTQATLSEAVEKLTDITGKFQVMIEKQNSQAEDIHDLFVKYNKLQEELYGKIAECQTHTIKIKTLCEEIKALKERDLRDVRDMIKTKEKEIHDTIRFRDKAFITLASGVLIYVFYELIKLL